MNIACLCPVIVGRSTELLANSIACFERQTYPAELRRLVVWDDVGQLQPQSGEGWSIETSDQRQPSLPAKYDGMINRFNLDVWADAYAVWDVDDVYLPHHLQAAAIALTAKPALQDARLGWVHPHLFYSSHPAGPGSQLGSHQKLVTWTPTGVLASESAAGRMHGSLVVGQRALERVGGWLGVMPRGRDWRFQPGYLPGDCRADFDQRMIAALEAAGANLPRSRPAALNPTYVYRWATIEHLHCSGFMRSPEDETWYQTYLKRMGELPKFGEVTPGLDAETADLIERWEHGEI